MRRDDELRSRLRRKFLLYGVVLPAALITGGGVLAWVQSRHETTTRATRIFLPESAADEMFDKTDGVVGLLFRVRADHDVQVTDLGVFDVKGDGLNLAHRVGVFSTQESSSERRGLLTEAIVPFGRSAPFQGGARWATLEKPLTLQAGKTYILAAETFGDVGDAWPGTITTTFKGEVGSSKWNPLVIGDGVTPAGELLLTSKPWPAIPDEKVPAIEALPHGLANMIVSEVE